MRKTGCPSSKGRPSTLLLAKVVNDSSTKSFISHEYHYFSKSYRSATILLSIEEQILFWWLRPWIDLHTTFQFLIPLINSTHYLNYCFNFMDKEVSILQICDPLLLIQAEVQDYSISVPLGFMSGLTHLDHNRWVAFSYGSSNAESRVLTMSPTV